MQQSHHQGIFPGSTRFNPIHPVPEFTGSSRYCPRFAKIYLQSHHHGSLRFAPVDTRQPPSLINQDHPGGHPFHPGGHPVHPGQHMVHPGQHTVHYGSLRFITMPYGSSRSTHGSLRCRTVHYGNSDHPGQHQVHYGSLRFIQVNTRFFQVNSRFELSPRFDAGSTELSNMSHLLKFVPGLPKVIKGSSRLVTGHPGSSRSTPGSSRLVNLGYNRDEP